VALRTVQAVRYVMPFREGSSVPALVEADDLGLYVVKLHGAAQGPGPSSPSCCRAGSPARRGSMSRSWCWWSSTAPWPPASPTRRSPRRWRRARGSTWASTTSPAASPSTPSRARGPTPPPPRASCSSTPWSPTCDALVTNVDRTPPQPPPLAPPPVAHRPRRDALLPPRLGALRPPRQQPRPLRGGAPPRAAPLGDRAPGGRAPPRRRPHPRRHRGRGAAAPRRLARRGPRLRRPELRTARPTRRG
jgi:hypothetical protein